VFFWPDTVGNSSFWYRARAFDLVAPVDEVFAQMGNTSGIVAKRVNARDHKCIVLRKPDVAEESQRVRNLPRLLCLRLRLVRLYYLVAGISGARTQFHAERDGHL